MSSKILVLISVSALATSCNFNESKPEAVAIENKIDTDSGVIHLTPEQVQTAAIETGLPEENNFFRTVKVSGVLETPPHNIVSISAPMAGFVKQLTLLPGTRVRAGETLAILEDQQYIQLQQDYLTTKSRLEYLKVDYERQKALNETKAASDKVYQQARTEFDNHKILLKSLGEKLRLIGVDPAKLNEETISRTIAIRSPLSGYVTEVRANTGKYLSSADVICEVVNPKGLHLDLKVFENDAASLREGMKVKYYANGDTAKKYVARIELIRPSIDDERTTEVHCELENSDARFLPGMFINAEIEVNNQRVKVLPEDAVVRWEQKTYVFVEDAPATYRMVPVETGAANNGLTELRSTLPHKKIVVKNAYTLLMEKMNGER